VTVYKTGRSTDYANAQTKRQYQSRKVNVTEDAIEQFENMARGLAPAIVKGDQVAWVADATLTDEDCQWCRQTAAEIARDAEIARHLCVLNKTELKKIDNVFTDEVCTAEGGRVSRYFADEVSSKLTLLER
jgi:broad specificity phosphatase PhoE